jgi:adenine phosphoribosyltransferase
MRMAMNQAASDKQELSRALALIRLIPDYPAPGVLFQDITPLLADGRAFAAVIKAMADSVGEIDVVAGVEARGFILGAALAQLLGIGFVPIRKKGKLPHTTISRQYGLEYGSDEIEIHTDSFSEGARVLLVDDVLATGGTLRAAIELVEDAGGNVREISLLSEIPILGGRELIAQKYPDLVMHTLIS